MRDSTIWTKVAHTVEHELVVSDIPKIVNKLNINTQVEVVKEIMADWSDEKHFDEIREWLNMDAIIEMQDEQDLKDTQSDALGVLF